MSQASQIPAQPADRKGRGSQTTWGQANAILEWLEVPANFKLITGGASQNHVIAGSKLKKTDAYRELALAVNKRFDYSRPSEIRDAKKAKSRYEAQLKKYKDMKRELNDVTGPKFCLTENELNCGMTIEIKRDRLFPQFQRWDNLFGGRQNISPSFTMEPGMNVDTDDHGEGEMVVLPDFYDKVAEDIDEEPSDQSRRLTMASTSFSDFSPESIAGDTRGNSIDIACAVEKENIENFKPPLVLNSLPS